MSRLDNYGRDFERRPFWTGTKLAAFGLLALFAVSMVGCFLSTASAPVTQGARVVRQIVDADNMLAQYRWFHDANQQIKQFPPRIKVAAAALAYAERTDTSRANARMTELTGMQQTCMSLIAEYNSRAERLDSGFFRNPEKVLPVAAAPWQPLPESYVSSWCLPPATE